MKKVIFICAVVLVVCVFFVPSNKVRADEATIDYQKEAIIFLCDDNAALAQSLDDLIGINILSFREETIILPTSHFFMVIKEMVTTGKRKDNYVEILKELYEDNYRLKFALKQKTFRAERTK